MPSSLGPPRLPPGSPAAAPEDPEAARLRFRGFRFEEAAGPPEALAQLRELCRRWLRPEAHSKEQMLELLVLEQFLGALPPEIQAWVQGQRPGSPEEAAALVESLRQDPGQLLGWIAARVLKPAVLPAAQEAEDSPERVPPLGAAAGERREDAPVQTEGSARLSCSVKEEPDADGLETASASPSHAIQTQEGPVGPGEPDSASFHAPGMQEEWGLLDPSQKELYWDALLEKVAAALPGRAAEAGAGAGVAERGRRGRGNRAPGPALHLRAVRPRLRLEVRVRHPPPRAPGRAGSSCAAARAPGAGRPRPRPRPPRAPRPRLHVRRVRPRLQLEVAAGDPPPGPRPPPAPRVRGLRPQLRLEVPAGDTPPRPPPAGPVRPGPQPGHSGCRRRTRQGGRGGGSGRVPGKVPPEAALPSPRGAQGLRPPPPPGTRGP
ncbi:zinc finger protein 446 isoform X1 [Pipistrellus kuhlii]|uniref:zinc finger protein 446 isoform X1 n=1 Tax=Pipistrellus kuhlii TaxID=59472 RepID=UPI001E2711BA|nr:zinc finger protein 446 isoform X1 [Pipistrellus kuhlii]